MRKVQYFPNLDGSDGEAIQFRIVELGGLSLLKQILESMTYSLVLTGGRHGTDRARKVLAERYGR